MFTIPILGLNGSGKHTLLERIAEKPMEKVHGMPVVEYVNVDFLQFKVISTKENENYHRQWLHHYQKANAVIYVMDVSDFSKQNKNIVYLNQCMKMTPDVPTIIFANKIDRPSIYDANDVLSEVVITRIHRVFPTSFLDKQGYGEGLEWLSEII